MRVKTILPIGINQGQMEIPVSVHIMADELEGLRYCQPMTLGEKEESGKFILNIEAILNLILMRLASCSCAIPAKAVPELWKVLMETEAELVVVQDGSPTGKLSMIVELGDWIGHIHQLLETL